MPETLVIRGGRVVDQTGERDADVLVADGRIVAVDTGLTGDRELDAAGCVVAPGLVDLHVHLREPGMEDAETIETGRPRRGGRRLHRGGRDAEHDAAAGRPGRGGRGARGRSPFLLRRPGGGRDHPRP